MIYMIRMIYMIYDTHVDMLYTYTHAAFVCVAYVSYVHDIHRAQHTSETEKDIHTRYIEEDIPDTHNIHDT